MVQFTIAYVVLGIGLLFCLGGVLVLINRSSRTALSDMQRLSILGGLGGMLVFLLVLFFRLR